MTTRLRFLLFPGIAVLGSLFLSLFAVGQIASYEVVQSYKKPDLDEQHCRFRLLFDQEQAGKPIEFSCNGVISTIRLDKGLSTELLVSPGAYIFQVYSVGFPELTTDSISIQPGFETVIAMHFIQRGIVSPDESPAEIKVLKPVIYTYAEADKAIDIRLQSKGKFIFTYPAYDNGWKGIVHADGSVTIADKRYPYLFWEGEQSIASVGPDYSTGFIVKQEEVIPFLEENLTQMGLNSKEQTDFITFWAPRMTQAEKGFVRFLFTDEYDQIASINVSPQPDHLFRVYMLWTPLKAGETIPVPTPQKIETVQREGFYVIEWGGSELPAMKSSLTLNR